MSGWPGILDPDGAREHLAAWKGNIDRLAVDTRRMSDRLQELRVTATDTNRMVEVTVDSSGSLVNLSLGERTQRVAPEVVARTIMATIREAKGQLAEKSKEIIADTLGTESVAAREIADRVEQQLTPPDLAAGDPDTSPHRW
ncbi:hypothetical protein ADL15_50690 [Actinoplanes awajinensis subsp. mycoplanecinus]|uniref:YbaB/EbfC DNA-binding family protein n=1 Tax=Actinoplanes awajinensis subsp. mycoplanecinus TaxID=135947 RepID=A0A117MJV6_9ACTN|nr:hypothetical protein ADL15_50690 [Actinoplanes awajinensis subsp. mycoplanecinus]